jgi:hypothetical protein
VAQILEWIATGITPAYWDTELQSQTVQHETVTA